MRTMLDPVPPHIELAIYGYLVLVASIGLVVHARLLHRRRCEKYADQNST